MLGIRLELGRSKGEVVEQGRLRLVVEIGKGDGEDRVVAKVQAALLLDAT